VPKSVVNVTAAVIPAIVHRVAAPFSPDDEAGVWYMRLMPWLALLLVLCACETTEEAPRVPFKLGHVSPPELPDVEATGAATSAHHFDSPVDRPQLEQTATSFVGARSLLAVDLDQDQDRDAVALVTDPAETLVLAVALRESSSFRTATRIQGLGLSADCEVDTANLTAVSSTKGLASIDARCGEPKQVMPKKKWLFGLETKPFVLERLEIMPAADPNTPTLNLSFSSADSDQDGHDDVLIDVSLSSTSGVATQERITLLDRSPALTFDAQAFETALGVRAERAKGLLRKTPADAGNEAKAVIALWTHLCRAADRPTLHVSGKPGLPCLPSKAAASARATWVSAEALQGHLREAIDGYVALSVLAPSEAKAALGEATKAMSRIKPTVVASLTPGPELADTQDADLRLPNARFISDTLLLLQRQTPVIYDLTTQTETPAGSSSTRVIDPSGGLALSALERRCAGISLRIERTSSEMPGASRVVSSPLLLARSVSPECVDTPQSVRRDTAGFRALGWAPQGLLLARGSEVRLVPLSLDGKPAGEARALDETTPRPAPLPAGRATPDGSHYAWLTPFGVVVFGAQNAPPALFRPAGWDAIGPSATDVAISPSGKQLAVLSGGRCYLLRQGETP